MKDKERFISIDDSGESIFAFDEADMIIDTKYNKVYGANNIPDLVKILNSQNSKWQKLKEFLNEDKLFDLFKEEFVDGYKNCLLSIKNKMRELEVEE